MYACLYVYVSYERMYVRRYVGTYRNASIFLLTGSLKALSTREDWNFENPPEGCCQA